MQLTDAIKAETEFFINAMENERMDTKEIKKVIAFHLEIIYNICVVCVFLQTAKQTTLVSGVYFTLCGIAYPDPAPFSPEGGETNDKL